MSFAKNTKVVLSEYGKKCFPKKFDSTGIITVDSKPTSAFSFVRWDGNRSSSPYHNKFLEPLMDLK